MTREIVKDKFVWFHQVWESVHVDFGDQKKGKKWEPTWFLIGHTQLLVSRYILSLLRNGIRACVYCLIYYWIILWMSAICRCHEQIMAWHAFSVCSFGVGTNSPKKKRYSFGLTTDVYIKWNIHFNYLILMGNVGGKNGIVGHGRCWTREQYFEMLVDTSGTNSDRQFSSFRDRKYTYYSKYWPSTWVMTRCRVGYCLTHQTNGTRQHFFPAVLRNENTRFSIPQPTSYFFLIFNCQFRWETDGDQVAWIQRIR